MRCICKCAVLCCLSTGIISLVVVVFSATVFHPLFLAQTNVSTNNANEVLFFGTLGYCHGASAMTNASNFNATCTSPEFGYVIDTSEILTRVWWSSMTKVISFFNPVALLAAFLAFGFGLFGVVTAAKYLSLIGLLFAVAGGVSVTIFILNNSSEFRGLGPGSVLLVYAIIVLFIVFITFADDDFNNPKAKKEEKGGGEPGEPRDEEAGKERLLAQTHAAPNQAATAAQA